MKKAVLKFRNIHRKAPVLESLFNKVEGLHFRLQNKCFPLNIVKFLRTPILKNIWKCSVKMVFFELLQNSQENSCARMSFLIKLQALVKKRFWHRCFPANFAKFLRTAFLTEHLQWLLSASSNNLSLKRYWLCCWFSAPNVYLRSNKIPYSDGIPPPRKSLSKIYL